MALPSPTPVSHAESSSAIKPAGGGLLARGWVVRLVIVVTLLSTAGMVSLIYVRWLTVQEPTATIVISGDSSWDGAQIILTPAPAGPGLPIILSQANEYSTPVHLQPGDYQLKVKLDDQDTFAVNIKASRFNTADIPLPTLVTVSGDATDDGANADLIGPDEKSDRQWLNSDSNYTAKWRRSAGTYHLTVIRNGETLYDEPNLVIAPHQPITINKNELRHVHD